MIFLILSGSQNEIGMEASGVGLNLLSLVATAITFVDAIRIRRRVNRSGQNHGAHIWSWINVRGKGCMVVVELTLLALRCERLRLIAFHLYKPLSFTRFVIFGIAYSLCAILIAWTSWANMRSWHALRDSQ